MVTAFRFQQTSLILYSAELPKSQLPFAGRGCATPAGEGQRPHGCWHSKVPCVQRRLRTRGCSREQGHHSSLFYTSLCSYLLVYNERGQSTFVIGCWGETMAVLTLPPPRRAESPSQGEFASRLLLAQLRHPGDSFWSGDGSERRTPEPPPLHQTGNQRNLRLGSSRGRRGGPGRQRGTQGRERRSCCHGPGAPVLLLCSPSGVASSL